MGMRAEQERLRAMLKDTITLMCKNGLTFDKGFSIDALIGITLDDNQVLLVSINECVKMDDKSTPDIGSPGSPCERLKPTINRKRLRLTSEDQSSSRNVSDVEDGKSKSGSVEWCSIWHQGYDDVCSSSGLPVKDVCHREASSDNLDRKDCRDNDILIKEEVRVPSVSGSVESTSHPFQPSISAIPASELSATEYSGHEDRDLQSVLQGSTLMPVSVQSEWPNIDPKGIRPGPSSTTVSKTHSNRKVGVNACYYWPTCT